MGSGSTASAFLDPDEVAIAPSDGVVVVSYFLPLIVTRASSGGGGNGTGSPGKGVQRGGSGGEDDDWLISWDQENLLSLRTRLRVTWVGTVRLPEGSGPLGREEQESLARALRRFDCVPVFIDPEQHERFYKTFCKGTLWPVFHHILDVYGPLPTRCVSVALIGVALAWFRWGWCTQTTESR
jgi:trehalose 6-phosphate synthase/phosphatase